MGSLAVARADANNTAPTKPHLIFAMVDDLGWSNVGWHNAAVHTPHCNALVHDGITLDRHYACTSWTPKHFRGLTAAAAAIGSY